MIIEFDGTYYHRDTPENKLRESKRDSDIINSGYEVIHIKENDYRNAKDGIVNYLLKMILDKNKE